MSFGSFISAVVSGVESLLQVDGWHIVKMSEGDGIKTVVLWHANDQFYQTPDMKISGIKKSNPKVISYRPMTLDDVPGTHMCPRCDEFI